MHALSLFGLDPRLYPEIGACLDAAAFDVTPGSLDQVFRLSLVTAHEDTIFDPTAGHVSRDEAVLLLDALSKGIGDPDLVFLPGDGWRNLLVWRGARDVRVKTVPPYEVVGRSVKAAFPRGTGTARLVAAIAKSGDLLPAHEVNECRADLQENPATLAWAWGPGVQTPLPSFESRTGVRAALVGRRSRVRRRGEAPGHPRDPRRGRDGDRRDELPRQVRRGADGALDARPRLPPRRRRRGGVPLARLRRQGRGARAPRRLRDRARAPRDSRRAATRASS